MAYGIRRSQQRLVFSRGRSSGTGRGQRLHNSNKVTDVARPGDFEDPPVVEVALSVAFQPIPRLGLVNLVEAWQEEFRTRYPRIEEQAPFEMPTENVGEPPRGPSIRFGLVSPPFSTRLWLTNEVGTQLLQLQQGLFARNWRKQKGAGEYPRYPWLVRSFEEEFGYFRNYLLGAGLSEPKATQVEVTYINHVEVPGDPGRALGRLLRMVSDRPTGFPQKPEQMRFGAQYLIQAGGGPVGRLHVTAEPAVRVEDAQPIVVLTLTARGSPLGENAEGIRAFLDVGREWAFNAFIGLTRPEMHQRWRRTDGS